MLFRTVPFETGRQCLPGGLQSSEENSKSDSLQQAVETRQEEAEMQGSRERKAEAYAQYVEVLSERQRSRSAPQ